MPIEQKILPQKTMGRIFCMQAAAKSPQREALVFREVPQNDIIKRTSVSV